MIYTRPFGTRRSSSWQLENEDNFQPLITLDGYLVGDDERPYALQNRYVHTMNLYGMDNSVHFIWKGNRYGELFPFNTMADTEYI